MRADEIDLRDGALAMRDGSHERPGDHEDDTHDDLVPLHDDTSTSATFDTVMRGYNKVQVEDYLDRVELALSEADQRHVEDSERSAAYEADLTALRERLALAERRAAGQPEPASLVGERLTAMLALAEQEAVAIRQAAKVEADRVLGDVRRRGERDTAERTAALEAREKEVTIAQETADKTRLDAQNDAAQLRDSARREAEQQLARAKAEADALVEDAARRAQALRTQADEDVSVAHDAAREQNAQDVEHARLRVDALTEQRDAVARQIQALRDQLAAIGASLGQAEG